MSSYTDTENNDNSQQQDKNHLGYDDNDVASKIEQVKANRAAKGKPVNADPSSSNNTKPKTIESVLGDETKNRMVAQSYKGPSMESSQAQIVQLAEPEPEPEQVLEKPLPNASKIIEAEENKNIKYWQNKIRENSASIQAPRTIEIQKRANKDKHVIYKFLDSKTPPKIGQKPDRKGRLIPIEVYYNEIENWRHLDWQKQRAEIAHLT
ncbi:MAG: hypothetical protein L0H53_09605, partial [Candidatus Nitrosocosmicus sp.]|nr:hypothetical protein [Candidatus Nitrosocosmicus sp.]